MYLLNLDDRIHFNHGGYVWHGFVTEIHDQDGQIQYMAKMKNQEVNDYNWYMKTNAKLQEVMVKVSELIM